jgi:hypothetical protein
VNCGFLGFLVVSAPDSESTGAGSMDIFFFVMDFLPLLIDDLKSHHQIARQSTQTPLRLA